MLQIGNLNYDSWATVCFQRGSVIVTELLLAYALYRWVLVLGIFQSLLKSCRYCESSPIANRKAAHTAALSVLLSPGLLIIDHIHFQYNGAMYGILVLSIVLARKRSTLLYSGVLFAALLCFKHIYLYLAPAYFVYLLRVYCLDPKSVFRPQLQNTFKLGTSVLAILGVAFGPFIAWGQLDQLKARLFPFSRGLCHAYWAPNVWALYSFTDRALIPGMFAGTDR